MKDPSTEARTAPQQPPGQNQPASSRPVWKRFLSLVFIPPIVVLLYFVAQDLFRASGEPEITTAGRVHAIQLDVLNGSGQPKLAQRMTDFLRARGFDVVEMGNYRSNDVEATLVLDRAGNMDAAKQVAMALGVSAERVRQQIDKSLYLDVSVVIGKDYSRLKAFQ